MYNLPDFREEKKLWKKGFPVVIGVDEVGRGAFAGPLVAGAVAFTGCHPEGAQRLKDLNEILRFAQNDNEIKIDDSKRLEPLERKRAAEWIKKNCLSFGIGEVGMRVINKLGIGKATQQAMRLAIATLISKFETRSTKQILPQSGIPLRGKNSNDQKSFGFLKTFVLSDAFHIKYLRGIGSKNQKAIKKGDQKSISIAAASILAKVYRDTLMRKLTKRYREYHWGRNKGYGTKKHQEAILKNGSTTLHRTQFVQTFLTKTLQSDKT